MSSNRGWTSCMNLYGDNENKHYVNCDIKKGTIIAYLINVNVTNINKPQARILIKSFILLIADSLLIPSASKSNI